MAITKKPFGKTPEGQECYLYTMTNASGASVSMTDFGATVTSIIVPDKDGVMGDVALGFDSLDGYLKPHGCMGETIGRYGNRIGNACFTLDGVTYDLYKNDGENHLHGGKLGFNAYVWDVQCIENGSSDTLSFHRVSPDGEENYPGTLDVTVNYSWNDACDLTIRYIATTDKATVCNMTNHTYFNLAGHDHGTVKDQVVYIDADAVTEAKPGLIPTGNYLAVTKTPFDLREGELLGTGLDQTADNAQMVMGGGYDHNYVLRKGCAFGLCACVHDEASGRTMEVLTDQPGVQLYTANTLYCEGGKGGVTYGQHAGLCLETQHYPDSPNNPQWPTTTLRPGELYDTTTIYAFRVDAE